MSHHKSAPPLTADQIDDNIEAGKSPEDTPGSNWHIGVDNDEVTEFDTRAKDLEVPDKSPASVILENPDAATFDSMFSAFASASSSVASTQSDQWQDIGTQILDAIGAFKQSITSLDDKEDWKGKTHDAAMANLTQSLAEPQALINGIGNLSALLNAFSDTIFQTRWYFTNWDEPYKDDLKRWPRHADEISQGFDSFARKVITTVYQPNIQLIADANPAFSSGQQVDVSNAPDVPPPPDDPPPPPPPQDIKIDGPPPPPDTGGPIPPPTINDPNLAGTGGFNDPNGSDPLDLSNLLSTGGSLSNVGSALGSGLSNSVGRPNGDGLGDGFDPLQLPGGPGAAFNALQLPGGSSDNVDPLQMPGGPGAAINALQLPGGSTDGFDASQLPGGPNGTPPDLSQLNDLLLQDPNSTGGLGNLPDLADGTIGTADGGSNGLSGLGNLGNGVSGLGSLGGGASGGGPAGAANGAGRLGSQLSSALGPASDALKQAASAAQSLGGGARGSTPGGVPALYPKGLDVTHGAGPGGAHAGGGGAGIGGRGLDPSRPAGVPVAGLGKGPALANIGASRLGIPGQAAGAGGSGSGSPSGGGGGGQRGPAGKEHKANKALRRSRNGELVIGEPDATIPVIGDDGVDNEAAEPSMPPSTPPAAAAAPARWPAPATGPRRPGAEQLRAELEL